MLLSNIRSFTKRQWRHYEGGGGQLVFCVTIKDVTILQRHYLKRSKICLSDTKDLLL